MAEKSQKPFSGYRWLATALALLVAVVILASFVTHKDDVIPVHKVTPIRGTIRSVHTIFSPDPQEPLCFYFVALEGAQLKEPVWFEYDELELIGAPLVALPTSEYSLG